MACLRRNVTLFSLKASANRFFSWHVFCLFRGNVSQQNQGRKFEMIHSQLINGRQIPSHHKILYAIGAFLFIGMLFSGCVQTKETANVFSRADTTSVLV